jgi:hypothetical protein
MVTYRPSNKGLVRTGGFDRSSNLLNTLRHYVFSISVRVVALMVAVQQQLRLAKINKTAIDSQNV